MPTTSDEPEGVDELVVGVLGADQLAERCDLASAGPVLRSLTVRERKVLFLRFMRDMTQSELAERVGCSQMQVSRILRASLEQLDNRLAGPTAA